MKHLKTIAALAASAILGCSLSGCGETEDRTIVVGASQTPHSEILQTIKEDLAADFAAQLSESEDGTIAVINGNYALQAGLNVKNALAVEDASGDAAQEYANIIAVKRGNEKSEKTTALLKALKTEKVYNFITNTYGGAVLPVFKV